MDFMNLNQAAHGDREFGFICSRLRQNRKVVVGHWQDEEVHARLDVWMRAACAWADSQRLKLARFGDNMREVAVTEGDKVAAQRQFGYAVNGYGVGDLVARIARATDAEVDRLVAEYAELYEVKVSKRRRWEPCAGGPDRDRPARLPRGGRFLRLHGHVRGPARPRAAPGARRPAPDGRRIRLRGRGRLEDRSPGPGGQGDGDRSRRRHLVHGGLHLPPRPDRDEGAGRPHARGLPDDCPRQAHARGAPARHRRKGRPRPPRLHTPRPGRR